MVRAESCQHVNRWTETFVLILDIKWLLSSSPDPLFIWSRPVINAPGSRACTFCLALCRSVACGLLCWVRTAVTSVLARCVAPELFSQDLQQHSMKLQGQFFVPCTLNTFENF